MGLKVAFVDYVLEPDKPGRSGLSDIVWDMASALADAGHEPHIVASYQSADLPDRRIPVHLFEAPPWGYRNVIGGAWLLWRARRVLRSLAPDVIHAPEYLSTALLSVYGVPAPVVLTVPGNIFQRLQEGNPVEWYYAQILKWAARTSARRCAAVIAISAEMKYWWQKTGSAPERTSWIPLGVDAKRFHRVPGARVRLGLSEDGPLLLYVGRYSREKGLLDLLDALAMLKPLHQVKPFQLMMVGAGPLAQTLRQQVQNKGLEQLIQMRQWVRSEELSTYYSAATALVLPSHTEGLSRTILEAMMCGTPIIGTKITGTEDHVRDGKTGYLVPPRDPSALAAVIGRAVRNPEHFLAMREVVRTYAQRTLTWEHTVARVVDEVYLPVIRARVGQGGERVGLRDTR